MNRSGPTEPGDDFGKLPRALLGLLLPPGRRDEFIGDLLEEARQRAARGGNRSANRWLWSQVFASCPSLVVARLRRIPTSVAVAVPIAVRSTAGSGALDRFLIGTARPPRSLAVSVSVLLHIAVLGALLVRGAWAVDELAGPRVIIKFWNGLPTLPPIFEEPAAPGPVRKVMRREIRPQIVRPQPAAVVLPTPVTPPPGAGGDGQGDGAGNRAGLEGDCPVGAPDCAGGGNPEPPRFVSPRVADKSCVSCPLPQLPPAYLRIGTQQSILTRICVDAAGRVVSAKILSGLGGSADDGVIATIEQWRFSPYSVDGRPVPFCYVSRFVFTPH
jgi:hypothetical protein